MMLQTTIWRGFPKTTLKLITSISSRHFQCKWASTASERQREISTRWFKRSGLNLPSEASEQQYHDNRQWCNQTHRLLNICPSITGPSPRVPAYPRTVPVQLCQVLMVELPVLASTCVQENCNTPQSTPQAIPIANYERNPFIACW